MGPTTRPRPRSHGPSAAGTPPPLGVRRWALVVAVATALCAACADRRPTPPPQSLTIATGWADGVWNIIGQALADQYRRQLPNAIVSATPIEDLGYKVDALEQGDLDLALVDSETAYQAYETGTDANRSPHTKLRAIAVLFPTVVQIVVRRDADITSIGQLRGKRLDVGPQGGYADEAARLVLDSYGLSYSSVHVSFDSTSQPERALQGHELDALAFWTPLGHPSITRVVNALPTTLLPLDREHIGVLQSRNHFLKSMTILGGTYPNQPDDVVTVGEDVLLLCRQDLPEDLVRRLTEILFDAAPELRRAHEAAAGIDVNRGPTASIPLHTGAARVLS